MQMFLDLDPTPQILYFQNLLGAGKQATHCPHGVKVRGLEAIGPRRGLAVAAHRSLSRHIRNCSMTCSCDLSQVILLIRTEAGAVVVIEVKMTEK